MPTSHNSCVLPTVTHSLPSAGGNFQHLLTHHARCSPGRCAARSSVWHYVIHTNSRSRDNARTRGTARGAVAGRDGRGYTCHSWHIANLWCIADWKSARRRAAAAPLMVWKVFAPWYIMMFGVVELLRMDGVGVLVVLWLGVSRIVSRITCLFVLPALTASWIGGFTEGLQSEKMVEYIYFWVSTVTVGGGDARCGANPGARPLRTCFRPSGPPLGPVLSTYSPGLIPLPI